MCVHGGRGEEGDGGGGGGGGGRERQGKGGGETGEGGDEWRDRGGMGEKGVTQLILKVLPVSDLCTPIPILEGELLSKYNAVQQNLTIAEPTITT